MKRTFTLIFALAVTLMTVISLSTSVFAADELVIEGLEFPYYDELGEWINSAELVSFAVGTAENDLPLPEYMWAYLRNGEWYAHQQRIDVVSWTCTTEGGYNPAQEGVYAFAPVLDTDDYDVLADGLYIPKYVIAIGEPFVGEGTVSSPYKVTTVRDLQALSDLVGAGKTKNEVEFAKMHYILTNDIDMGGHSFTPIGNRWYFERTFSGTFNGNGHEISNLTIIGEDDVGLFADMRNCVIMNLGLVDVTVSGRSRVGGLVGNMSEGSTISGCYVTGTVSMSDGVDVGGIAGWVGEGCVINRCYFNGDVSGDNMSVGGIAGTISDGRISECYVSGSVSGTVVVGGISGWIHSTDIINCYVTGDITGTDNGYGSYQIGGIVGTADDGYYGGGSTINNCYVTGDVSGGGYTVGGVAGSIFTVLQNNEFVNVTNCAVLSSSVSGHIDYPFHIGRIIGEMYEQNGTFQNNVALAGMTGFEFTGDPIFDGVDCSLSDIYSSAFWADADKMSWDSNIWIIEDGKLPLLRRVGESAPDPSKQTLRRDYLTVTGTGSFVYSGEPREVEVTLNQSGDFDSVTVYYNGAVTPPINVGRYLITADFIGSTTYNDAIGMVLGEIVITPVSLVEGVDYTVEYSENKAAGTGSVTITGIGNYSFSSTKTFAITADKGDAHVPYIPVPIPVPAAPVSSVNEVEKTVEKTAEKSAVVEVAEPKDAEETGSVRVYTTLTDVLRRGHTDSATVTQVRSLFEKWYKNKIRVISLNQKLDWKSPVTVSAKVDISGMNITNLYFYAYNAETDTYRIITTPNYWIDTNGNLRFTTPYAGEIVISDGKLERR